LGAVRQKKKNLMIPLFNPNHVVNSHYRADSSTYVVMDSLCIIASFVRPGLTILFSILPTECHHLHSQNKQRLSSRKNH
jgi:hypothetical protein